MILSVTRICYGNVVRNVDSGVVRGAAIWRMDSSQTSIKFIFFYGIILIHLHVVPFEVHFHYVDNAFMCTT